MIEVEIGTRLMTALIICAVILLLWDLRGLVDPPDQRGPVFRPGGLPAMGYSRAQSPDGPIHSRPLVRSPRLN